MKVEVIDRSTKNRVKTYYVTELSLFDFQQWKEEPHQMIALENLLEIVSKLDSRDAETEEPNSGERMVDFFLPDPLKRRVSLHISELRRSADEGSDHSEDITEAYSEGFSISVLKSSTVLAAAVTEILLNHRPHSNYKAKISHG